MAPEAPQHKLRSKRGSRNGTAAWARLSDEELLEIRFSDLKLRIDGTPLERAIRRLQGELERAGLRFRPHFWLADEWFSPDGVPGIAVPFYLTHPRLRRLERRMMQEVEGGNANWLMRILRHEAGHALDSAFRLRRRRRWREVFGPASLPYPDSYRPRPGSRRFVQHLGSWYAQSHPAEDFAETFAVWLKPGSGWRRAYQDWPALEKLEYVDELMRDLKGRSPPVRKRAIVDPLSGERRTLGEHYRARLDRYTPVRARVADDLIRRVFIPRGTGRRALRAATLVRQLKQPLRTALAARLEVSEYLIHQLLRLVIQRCEALDLYVAGPRRAAREHIEWLLLRLVRLYTRGTAGRHAV